MGILRWLFGSDERVEIVTPTKVIVGYVDHETKVLAESDAEVYAKYYLKPDVQHFSTLAKVAELISGTDIVHLVSSLDDDGEVRLAVTGTHLNNLIRQCAISNVKVLWLAGHCLGEGFTNAKPVSAGVHLVVTFDRRGELFTRFLDHLFGLMSKGTSMPIAWNRVTPQIPGMQHEGPGCVFIANRGQIQLLP
jgi:hypothetical protein